jgi:hypothetical protein
VLKTGAFCAAGLQNPLKTRLAANWASRTRTLAPKTSIIEQHPRVSLVAALLCPWFGHVLVAISVGEKARGPK